jgi:hypothetical protein
LTIWAPRFSYLILELDLLGDGDAVLGDGGGAEGLFEDDDAAGGAEGDLDGAGELLHAAENALAGVGVVCDQDVVLAHHQVLVAVELDLGAGVAGEDHAVALLDGEGDALAGVGVEVAGADGLDGAGLGLVLAGLGQEDARVGLGRGLVTLDEDLVAQGTDGGAGAFGSGLGSGGHSNDLLLWTSVKLCLNHKGTKSTKGEEGRKEWGGVVLCRLSLLAFFFLSFFFVYFVPLW